MSGGNGQGIDCHARPAPPCRVAPYVNSILILVDRDRARYVKLLSAKSFFCFAANHDKWTVTIAIHRCCAQQSRGNQVVGNAAPIRVAFIAHGSPGHSRRLANGVSRFASPGRGYITRDFLLGYETQELPAAVSAWRPDAVVSFLSADDLAMLAQVREQGIPIANTSRSDPAERLAVVLGDAEEAYDAVHAHFRELGVKSIWQFSMGESLVKQNTQQRYRQYTQAKRLPSNVYAAPDPEQIDAINQQTVIAAEVAQWLTELPKPAGIFSQQTYAGQYLCRACELLGLRVPAEIAIIGSDGFDIATASHPPVTSIRVPAEAVGFEAARLAAAMLDGAPAPAEFVLVKGTRLIHRGSTRKDVFEGCNIDRALSFIDEHACEGIKVNDVISHTQRVSRVTFHKRFLEQVGSTPADIIQARKLDEARRLLAETEMSSGTIAGMCGYEDYIHFYRVFRKYEGVSPTQYRQMAQ